MRLPGGLKASGHRIDLRLPDDDCALQRRVRVPVVIVIAAGADGIQIARLAALFRLQESDLIDLRAIRVVGMRIRAHIVRAGVVVHERHA